MKTQLMIALMLATLLPPAFAEKPQTSIPAGEKGVLGPGQFTDDGQFTLMPESLSAARSRAEKSQGKAYGRDWQEGRPDAMPEGGIVGRTSPT